MSGQLTRSETTKAIKKALKRRSGRDWSVTGDRGTAWGWLTIQAPKSRRVCHDPNPAYDAHHTTPDELPWIEREPKDGEIGWYTSQEDRETLASLLGIGMNFSSAQGVSISPDSWDFYLDRAENGPPALEPEPDEMPEPEPIPDVPQINPGQIKEIDGDLRINVLWPTLNKNSHIEQYLRQVPDDCTIETARITHLVTLSAQQYDDLVNGNLLTDFDWMAGNGGASSDAKLREVDDWFSYTEEEKEIWKEQAYILAMEIKAPGRDTIFVNPEGHSYARYVGFVEPGAALIIKTENKPTANPLEELTKELLKYKNPGEVLNTLIGSGMASQEALSLLAKTLN